MKKLFLNKDNLLIAYKLLHDAFLLALASFTLMLIGEGLIPGFVSQRLSFSKVAIAIILLIGSIAWLGRKLQITYEAPKIKGNKLLPFLVLAAFLLIGNSMLHFDLWVNIVITLTSLFVMFLVFEIFFLED